MSESHEKGRRAGASSLKEVMSRHVRREGRQRRTIFQLSAANPINVPRDGGLLEIGAANR